jgi:sulfur carrier protein ThiS
MEIQVKLMGLLRDKMPAEGRLTLTDDSTIADALAALNIPPESVQVFTVNGQLVRDRGHALASGDTLTILPPVGGG